MSSFHQPGPWIEVESKKHTGRNYYSNTITNESQWEPPNGKDFISKSGEFNTSRFMKYLSANPNIDLLEEGESQYRETGGTSPDFIQFVLDNTSVVDMDINNLMNITVNIIKTILERLGEPPSELFSLVLFASGHGGSRCISNQELTNMASSANVLSMPIVPPGKDGYNFTKEEGMNIAFAIAKKRGNLLSREEKEPFRNRIIQQYRRVEREIYEKIEVMRSKISTITSDITIAEKVNDTPTPDQFTPFRIEDAQYATPSPLITAHTRRVCVSQGSSGTDEPAFVNEKRCKTIRKLCKKYDVMCETVDDPVNALIEHLRTRIHELELRIQIESEKVELIRTGIDEKSVANVVNSSANMQILASCTKRFANIMGLFVVKPTFEAKYPIYSRIIMILLAEIDEIYRTIYKRDEIAINGLFINEPGYKPNVGMFYRLLDGFSRVYKGRELNVRKMIIGAELHPSQAILLIGDIFVMHTAKIDIMYVNSCCRRTMPHPDPETIVGSPPKGGTRRRRRSNKTRQKKTRR